MSKTLVAQTPRPVAPDRKGNQRWDLQVYVGVHRQTGAKVNRMKRFTGSLKEAKRAAAEYAAALTDQMDELLGGAEEVPEKERVDPQITFGALTNKHYYPRQFPKWKPTTRLARRGDIDAKLATRPIWNMRVRAIQAVDIDDLYSDLRDHGSASGGPLADISAITQIVSGVMKLARRKGVRKDDPTEDADASGSRPAIRRNACQITMDEFVAAWTAAQELDPQVGAMLGVEIISGARRSELTGFRWTDFDPFDQTLTVWGPITFGLDDDNVRRLCVNTTTKTGEPERVITLGWDAVQVVQDHRQWAEQRAAEAGQSLRPESYIFSSDPDGTSPYHPTSVGRMIRKVCEQAGLPSVELQQLRGLVSSLLIASGVDQAAYQAHMGHSFATAFRFYVAATKAQKAAASESLSSTIAGYVAANRTGDSTEAEAALLKEVEPLLSKLPAGDAERYRRSVLQALAVETARVQAAEAALAKAKVVNLADRRTATPQSMALEIANGLRATGAFRVTAQDEDQAKEWRKAARWVGRAVLHQPVRTACRGLIVTMELLGELPVETTLTRLGEVG